MVFLINVLYQWILSFWWGAMVFFTFIATPVIFRELSPDLSALTVGKLFPSYFLMGTLAGLGLVLAGAYRYLAFSGQDGKKWVGWALILVSLMLAVNLVNQFMILPDMQQIQSQIPTFEGPKEGNPLRLEFGRLHGISMALNLANILMGAGALAMAAKSMDRPTFF